MSDNETNAWNALYERPAILSLAGDVRGLRVLDAGCGEVGEGECGEVGNLHLKWTQAASRYTSF